jgi:D-alanyl-lipoteichoic acid acyltransferase DltB (MBOAT superfamily)
LIANLGVLIEFKYANFIADNINQLFSFSNSHAQIPLLEIALPIGLSFHTFQAMSYTIEVYRKNQKAEHHFGTYALYVMFYPQLVAGPIERPQNILHQFKKKINFSYANFKTGLVFIFIGLIKKIVIADRLGYYVDSYYDNLQTMTFLPTVISITFYSFQIYCDFSGYSSIAIGTAKCLGINLMKNFDRPYSASTLRDFWKKWHISLSSWFRDYVFIPLGGSKVSPFLTNRNLLIVFLLSGIWHGAKWTFVFWGLIHATFLIIENITKNTRLKIENKYINQFFIFVIVSIAWVFFRAPSFDIAYIVLKKLISLDLDFRISQIGALVSPLNLFLSFMSIIILYFLDNIRFAKIRKDALLFFIIGTLLIILIGKTNEAQFIYFQF